MANYFEQAEKLVKLVRSYTTTHDEAVDLIDQALKTAHSGGVAEGFKQGIDDGLKAFDKAAASLVGGPQTEAISHFAKSGG